MNEKEAGGATGSEVRKRVQVGWSRWSRREVTPAGLFGLETEAALEGAELKMLRFS